MEPNNNTNNAINDDQPSASQDPVLNQPLDSEPVSTEPTTQTEPALQAEPSESTAPTEPAPQAEPIEQTSPSESTDATTSTESTQVPPVSEPKKSSKTGAIVLSIILVVLMIAGGIGIVLSLPSGQDGKQIDNSGKEQETSATEKEKYDLGTISDFDLSFLKQENKGENIIYSPLSIKYALAMLADASANNSEAQIRSLIGDFKPKLYINSENLSLANAMFIRNEVKDEIYETYTDTIKQNYNAEVVYDSFETPDPANKWISDRTLGIIKQTLGPEDITDETDYLLINALAIDMDWNNLLQCAWNQNNKRNIPCKDYFVGFSHEKYSAYIDYLDSNNPKGTFNGSKVAAAEIGATANRYDIVKEIGEDNIRTTVLNEYEEYKKKNGEDEDFDIDKYMSELSENYGKLADSTDFYYSVTDDEKVFAKDLKEYDGTMLQYIGIMPKTQDLSNYIESLNADKVASLVNNLKDSSDINSFKDGVITKITGTIPFFKFSYDLKLKEDLIKLGVTDVFDSTTADLSRMTSLERPRSFIQNAIHKANIDFSNEGIKAAAVSVVAGGRGGKGGFEYQWDVPVEEIDLSFDKPFFFIIRDKSSGAVWFTGSVFQVNE